MASLNKCPQENYIITKVARATITPTNILEDERETAPLVWLTVSGLVVVVLLLDAGGAAFGAFARRASLIS